MIALVISISELASVRVARKKDIKDENPTKTLEKIRAQEDSWAVPELSETQMFVNQNLNCESKVTLSQEDEIIDSDIDSEEPSNSSFLPVVQEWEGAMIKSNPLVALMSVILQLI